MGFNSHMILLRKPGTGMRKCGSPCGQGVSIPLVAISYRGHYTSPWPAMIQPHVVSP